eukprot:7384083-Prymnesium_polylepis.2
MADSKLDRPSSAVREQNELEEGNTHGFDVEANSTSGRIERLPLDGTGGKPGWVAAGPVLRANHASVGTFGKHPDPEAHLRNIFAVAVLDAQVLGGGQQEGCSRCAEVDGDPAVRRGRRRGDTDAGGTAAARQRGEGVCVTKEEEDERGDAVAHGDGGMSFQSLPA